MQATPCRSVAVCIGMIFLLLLGPVGIDSEPQEFSDSTTLNATPKYLNYLEIIGPDRIVSADESVPLDLRWHDSNGSNVSVLVPLDNWTAESGNFRTNDGFVEWLPSLAGTWRISVFVEDVEAWIDLTVTPGQISHVWIDAEYDILTADGETSLILQAEDSRGNRWPISAEWSVEQTEAGSSLISDIDGVRFVGELSGTWTVSAVHTSPNGTFSTDIPIEVRPGRLARILLAGDGTTVSSDDSVDLAPQLSDADGNTITGVQLNWTVNGEDITPQLRLSGGIWQPVLTGDHIIEVDAAGRSARSRIYVTQGDPHRIQVNLDLPTGASALSGDVFQIATFSEDLAGNLAPWPVEWSLPMNSLDIEETTEIGVYDARGLGEGIWDIEVQNGTALGNFTIQVMIGEARTLRIGQHGGVGDQGDEFSLEVSLVDYGGNIVPTQISQFEFDTGVGTVRHDLGPYWYLELDHPGDNQKITVRYEQWSAETYVDVNPTGIDKLTNSQSGQMLLFGFGAAAILIAILLLIVRKNSEPELHWDDEFEFIGNSDDIIDDVGGGSVENTATPLSRRSRRRINHQRQQNRIRAMEDATQTTEQNIVTPEPENFVQSTGVLQAMQGTIQGQTGWYQTAQGDSQYWQVGVDGQWSRVK